MVKKGGCKNEHKWVIGLAVAGILIVSLIVAFGGLGSWITGNYAYGNNKDVTTATGSDEGVVGNCICPTGTLYEGESCPDGTQESCNVSEVRLLEGQTVILGGGKIVTLTDVSSEGVASVKVGNQTFEIENGGSVIVDGNKVSLRKANESTVFSRATAEISVVQTPPQTRGDTDICCSIGGDFYTMSSNKCESNNGTGVSSDNCGTGQSEKGCCAYEGVAGWIFNMLTQPECDKLPGTFLIGVGSHKCNLDSVQNQVGCCIWDAQAPIAYGNGYGITIQSVCDTLSNSMFNQSITYLEYCADWKNQNFIFPTPQASPLVPIDFQWKKNWFLGKKLGCNVDGFKIDCMPFCRYAKNLEKVSPEWRLKLDRFISDNKNFLSEQRCSFESSSLKSLV